MENLLHTLYKLSEEELVYYECRMCFSSQPSTDLITVYQVWRLSIMCFIVPLVLRI